VCHHRNETSSTTAEEAEEFSPGSRGAWKRTRAALDGKMIDAASERMARNMLVVNGDIGRVG
jgi:citrate lyase beta subunit